MRREETLEEMEAHLRRHTERWAAIAQFFGDVWTIHVFLVIAIVELLPYIHMACHKD